jgi:formylglycine-generating enzyme required for sulfatase activity
MAGNVWEWTADLWHSYPGAAVVSDDGYRVLRGGSYMGHRTAVRCSVRLRFDPDDGYGRFGFRLVVPLPEPPLV